MYIIEASLTFGAESSSISTIIGRPETGMFKLPFEFNTVITYNVKRRSAGGSSLCWNSSRYATMKAWPVMRCVSVDWTSQETSRNMLCRLSPCRGYSENRIGTGPSRGETMAWRCYRSMIVDDRLFVVGSPGSAAPMFLPLLVSQRAGTVSNGSTEPSRSWPSLWGLWRHYEPWAKPGRGNTTHDRRYSNRISYGFEPHPTAYDR
jgi:hypothetical protein